MRRLWGALFLITFLSDGNARIINISTDDENSSVTTSRPDNTREGRNGIIALPQDETEDQASVLAPNETSSAGGGVRLLDPKFLKSKDSCPPAEAPWWERWWFKLSNWFSEDR